MAMLVVATITVVRAVLLIVAMLEAILLVQVDLLEVVATATTFIRLLNVSFWLVSTD
jgi:hypothetical protein